MIILKRKQLPTLAVQIQGSEINPSGVNGGRTDVIGYTLQKGEIITRISIYVKEALNVDADLKVYLTDSTGATNIELRTDIKPLTTTGATFQKQFGNNPLAFTKGSLYITNAKSDVITTGEIYLYVERSIQY